MQFNFSIGADDSCDDSCVVCVAHLPQLIQQRPLETWDLSLCRSLSFYDFPRCYVDPDRVGKTLLSSDGSARVRANALSCLRRSGAPSFEAGPLDGSVCRCAQCYDDGHLKRFGKD
jgi:hypothetical protein